jgi:hypothetical protein
VVVVDRAVTVSECWRCRAEFTDTVPRVFCVPCRTLAAAEVVEARAEVLTRFYRDHPDAPMPGDRVRRRTDDDRAFARAVMADLAEL